MEHNSFKISKESVEKLFPKQDLNIDILGYESPIQIAIGQMRMEQENNIYKAIQEQSVNVDKDELIKALRYDRDQYEKGYVKGYVNGYNAKASEVVAEVLADVMFAISKIVSEHIESDNSLTEAEIDIIHALIEIRNKCEAGESNG